MRIVLLQLLPALALLFTGCYYDNEEELYPSSYCDTTAVTWSLTIEPLIQAECAVPACHVAGDQTPYLDTYTGVKAIADDGRLRGVTIDGDPFFMPSSGKLPFCRQQEIQAWLDAGAPNN
jgi:hypothetical protein